VNRNEVLDGAKSAIGGDRQDTYGDARENFTRIGTIWEVIFGHPVTPEQVALCMAGLKIARLVHRTDHADGWLDMAGYAALGGEIATAS
jgi:hypothetical protein